MCAALGYRVVGLNRVRIMHIDGAGLAAGQWAELTAAELDLLFAALGKV